MLGRPVVTGLVTVTNPASVSAAEAQFEVIRQAKRAPHRIAAQVKTQASTGGNELPPNRFEKRYRGA
jgi:hypothetical protein